jgi:putative transposase
MSNLAYQFFYRRRLPHYQPPGATLFTTFRLAESLPQAAIERLVEEAKQIEKRLAQITDPRERARQTDRAQRRLFGKWDKLLDTSTTGPHWLKQAKIASRVAENLYYSDQKAYDLHAYCIMPNHAHLVYQPLVKPDGSYHARSAIMHSLKRHTAKECNQLLGRTGEFWQHENYDHVIRDEAEWQRVIRSVIGNPVSAGLVEQSTNWKWSYCKHGLEL